MLKVIKFGPWVAGLGFFLLMVMSIRGSCSNTEWIPFLGKWTGQFRVISQDLRPMADASAKRLSLPGYVMVYAMNRSFRMHLEGTQEILDVNGVWTQKGHRLTMTPSEVKIDDEGGAAGRNPNLPFIDGADVRSAYSHPFILELSADKRSLNGLTMSMGDLQGRHEFARD